MTLALDYSDRVDKLVLISPAGFERFENGEGDWLVKVMTPDLVKDTPIRSIDDITIPYISPILICFYARINLTSKKAEPCFPRLYALFENSYSINSVMKLFVYSSTMPAIPVSIFLPLCAKFIFEIRSSVIPRLPQAALHTQGNSCVHRR